MTASHRPAFASDDWILEQQMKAELEAEAWRRLRLELAVTQPVVAPLPPAPVAPPAPAAPRFDPHKTGSAILKGLVRFALATFGAYLCYLAGVDGGLGEFEIWLATGAGFLVTLALSMFGAFRQFVHFMAEAARWCLIFAVGLGAVWMMMHMQA